MKVFRILFYFIITLIIILFVASFLLPHIISLSPELQRTLAQHAPFDIIRLDPSSNHLFWTDQPVLWNPTDVPDISGCDTLEPIGKLPEYSLKMPQYSEFRVFDLDGEQSGTSVETQTTILCDFLNTHFSPYLRMSRDVIKSHLRNKGAANIGFYIHNELVGFIHGRPIRIVYKETEYTIHYVEYLCVVKEYRQNYISPLLISRYIQEMERKTGNNQLFILFKKDGRRHPFQSFVDAEYRYADLNAISTNPDSLKDTGETSAISSNHPPEILTEIFNQWILYTAQFTFHRTATESELITPATKVFICGIDGIAIIAKESQLYEKDKQTYIAIIDIEYIVELGEPIDESSTRWVESYPWTWMDLVEHLKRQKYGYITINDIGRHREIVERIDIDKTLKWESANPFQYYAFNFKCPRIPKDDFYLTIN